MYEKWRGVGRDYLISECGRVFIVWPDGVALEWSEGEPDVIRALCEYLGNVPA